MALPSLGRVRPIIYGLRPAQPTPAALPDRRPDHGLGSP
jgi:hypothetical protein